jgi:hypothetical protein
MKVVNWMITLTCFLLLIRCAPFGIVSTGSEEHKATILCFTGGSGRFDFSWKGGTYGRSKYYFISQGIKMEALSFDFPKGRKGQVARTTDSHFQVIQKKVNDLKKNGHERIWLMGLSNGAISVTYAGARNILGVKGLIVINPPRESYLPVRNNQSVVSYYGTFVEFEKITLPILMVTHEMDNCGLRNWSKQFLRGVYPSSANSEMVTFSGGRTGTSPEATHLTVEYQHGLRGLEKEFAQAVINFIDSNSDITEARK